jgi:hypothetical protein
VNDPARQWSRNIRLSVTRWVCLKNRPICDPIHFFVKINTYCLQRKK